MKKQFLLLILIPCLMIYLSACGSSRDSAPTSGDSQTNTTQSDDPQPTVDNSVPETEPNPGDISSTANSEQPDNSQTPDDAQSDGPKGLIIMTTVSATGGPHTITISTLNPETGSLQAYAQFSYGQFTDGVYSTPNGDGANIGRGYYATRCEWFDADYSAMAMSLMNMSTGESHAGWVDQNGEFFDVTAALGLQSKSDFDDRVFHAAIGFTNNEQFVYEVRVYEGTGFYREYYSVPLNNLTASAVVSGIALPGLGEDYRSSFTENYPDNRITDYSDSGSYITNERDGASLLHDSSGSTNAYVPGTSRLSWNGVFSPDESRIAFMSNPKTGGAVDIYTMPVAGGDPVKVETNFELAQRDYCEIGRYVGGNPCSMLIDWK